MTYETITASTDDDGVCTLTLDRPEALNSFTVQMARDLERFFTTDAYDDARRTSSQARGALAEVMADVDVILSPSAPGAAPKGLGSTGSSTFNRLWTLMGPPCVNVPGLADPQGLPLGIQVIGRFGHDHATLEAALFIESLVPGRRDSGN